MFFWLENRNVYVKQPVLYWEVLMERLSYISISFYGIDTAFYVQYSNYKGRSFNYTVNLIINLIKVVNQSSNQPLLNTDFSVSNDKVHS